MRLRSHFQNNIMAKFIKAEKDLNDYPTFYFEHKGVKLDFNHKGELVYHSLDKRMTEKQRLDILKGMAEFSNHFPNKITINTKWLGLKVIIIESTIYNSKIEVTVYKDYVSVKCRNFNGTMEQFEDYIKSEDTLRLLRYQMLIKNIKNEIEFIKIQQKLTN